MFRTGRLSKSSVFAGLMVLSALLLLLPPAWSDSLKHLMQVLVPGQSALYAGGVRAARALERLDQPPLTPDEAGRLTRENAALRNEIAFQSGLLEQLRTQNASLRSLRERYVPPDIRLIPARIAGRDVVMQRDSILLDSGARRGASWQDWVVSRLFLDVGADDGAERGYAVLTREYLIGRVELVSPYMARVRLLTDVDSRIAAQIGRVVGGKFVPIDYPCTLRGRGRGAMVIEDVPQHLVEIGTTAPAERRAGRRIETGDIVASAAEEVGLPAPLVVGRIAAIRLDPKKRLVATLDVEPAVLADEVADVFIVAASPRADDLDGGFP